MNWFQVKFMFSEQNPMQDTRIDGSVNFLRLAFLEQNARDIIILYFDF